MNRFFTSLFVILLAAACFAQEQSDRLLFPNNGYSIEPLEAKADSVNYQALIMYLPPEGSFASNVNVQIQPFDGTIEDYVNLSKEQFDKTSLTLIKHVPVNETTATFEYSGTMRGRTLHWYGRAEKGDGKVYLVTATTIDSLWQDVSPQLIKCVDSFKLEKGE